MYQGDAFIGEWSMHACIEGVHRGDGCGELVVTTKIVWTVTFAETDHRGEVGHASGRWMW